MIEIPALAPQESEPNREPSAGHSFGFGLASTHEVGLTSVVHSVTPLAVRFSEEFEIRKGSSMIFRVLIALFAAPLLLPEAFARAQTAPGSTIQVPLPKS